LCDEAELLAKYELEKNATAGLYGKPVGDREITRRSLNLMCHVPPLRRHRGPFRVENFFSERMYSVYHSPT